MPAPATGGAVDADALTRDASLNKLLVGEPAVLGGELLGRDAVAEMVGHVTGRPVDRRAMSDAIAASEDATVELGRRIAALVETLRHARTAADQGATPGRRAYLEHWATAVADVYLGGGLLASGGCCAAARDVAQQLLDDSTDVPPTALHATDRPELLPLLGAARTAPPPGTVERLVLDGGQSAVKRAIARHDPATGALRSLQVLPAVPLAEVPHFVPPATRTP